MPPFETFHVKTTDAARRYQSPEAIAEEVSEIYERVAKLGGEVVAQTVVDGPTISTRPSPLRFRQKCIQRVRNAFDSSPAEVTAQVILITADLPERPSPEA